MLPEVAKRLVLDAVVAKKLVVVAEVPVAVVKVKFWRVEDPVTKREPFAAESNLTSSLAREVVAVAPEALIKTWLVEVPSLTPLLLYQVQLISDPPPLL